MKVYLDVGYLSKLEDEYNNIYHRSIGKKSIDSGSSEPKLSRILIFLNLKWVIQSELLSTKIFLAKVTPNIGQETNLLLILC